MIPYMVGKLAPETTRFTSGLVTCPREGFFSCRPLPKRGQICDFPSPFVERVMTIFGAVSTDVFMFSRQDLKTKKRPFGAACGIWFRIGTGALLCSVPPLYDSASSVPNVSQQGQIFTAPRKNCVSSRDREALSARTASS